MKATGTRYFITKVFPSLLILFFAMAGIIKVDIINTKALSPLGNSNENYNLISKEFGSDFSNFIKDNSFLKIYKEEGENILIRLGNENFKINSESSLTNSIKGVFNKIDEKVRGVKKTVDKMI